MNKASLSMVIYALEQGWGDIATSEQYLVKGVTSYYLAGDEYTQARVNDIYRGIK